MKKFKHKKSLGQNFLKNDAIINDIVDSSNIIDEDIILEIGPGQGILTKTLAQRSGKVIAIELDDRLIPDLKKEFENNDNVEIIHDDILKLNIEKFSEFHGLKLGGYKVVANIPYYITAPIIRLFLESSNQPSEIILMVQKEVAERLTASPGEMSILAVSAQYYANVEYLFTVPKDDFDPVPKVDSAIIKLTVKNNRSSENEVKEFFRIVKIGFSAKRKTLINNLANGLHQDKKAIEKIVVSLNFDKNVRAQELSVENWLELSKMQSLTEKREA